MEPRHKELPSQRKNGSSLKTVSHDSWGHKLLGCSCCCCTEMIKQIKGQIVHAQLSYFKTFQWQLLTITVAPRFADTRLIRQTPRWPRYYGQFSLPPEKALAFSLNWIRLIRTPVEVKLICSQPGTAIQNRKRKINMLIAGNCRSKKKRMKETSN